MAKNILLAIGSILLTLLGVEAGLRIVGWPTWRNRTDPGLERLVCRYDAGCGWRGSPHVNLDDLFFEEFLFSVYTNRSGWREREFDLRKPPGVTRIALLGDSFTWGLNVRVEKTFHRVLERLLGGRNQTMSFGMPDYSTDQELITLRSDVLGYDPDIVVLGLYLDDVYFNGNIGFRYPKPAFEIGPGGRLEAINVPVPDLRSRWRLVELVKRQLYGVKVLLRTPSASYRKRGFLNVMDAGYLGSRDWKITERLLEEIDRECSTRGIRFAVMVIPFDLQIENPSDDLPQQALLEFGRRTGIPVLDLLPILTREGGTSLIFQRDLHWNEKGHAVVGNALFRFLGEHGLIASGTKGCLR